MIDPIAIGQTKEYICKEDKVNPTVWIIGSIDSIEQAEILNKVSDKEKDVIDKNNSSLMLFEIIRFGLKGFKNFKDVQFETETIKSMDKDRQVVTENIIKMIPFSIISELAMEIWGSNKISEAQEKN